MSGPIRVLVVDDSALMRHRLGAIISSAAGYDLVGIARDGAECIEKVRALRPDVLTLDVEMPGMDGLSTLRQLMAQAPTPVLMVSSLTEAGAQTTLDALALGAVDYLAKPSFLSMSAATAFGVELLDKLSVVARARMLHPDRPIGGAPGALPRSAAGASTLSALPRRSLPAVPMPATPALPAHRQAAPVAPRADTPLVVIGSSTGGPQALDQLFSTLPPDLAVAYLVVQHMPPLFTTSLAARLSRRAGLPAREAQEGDVPAAGTILVAPGGWHVTLGRDHLLHLDQTDPIHGVRPAVDRTVHSVVEHWRGPCLVVILTGMGVDGADAAVAARQRGMDVFTQDESTCVVFGMPRAVIEAGAATSVFPLDRLGSAVAAWAHAPAAAPARVG